MKTPHLLLAAGNCQRLKANLLHLLDSAAIAAIDADIEANAKQMLSMADEYLAFAQGPGRPYWRQRVSRLYYAAYMASRALRLHTFGAYSVESNEHKRVGELPPELANVNRYATQLPVLREDRNLCDYDHTASVSDLAISLSDAEVLVVGFIADVKSFLAARGLSI